MNIGIIGLGRIGEVHLKAIQQTEGVQVVAVSDIDKDYGQQVATNNNISYFFTDFQELIDHKEVEAVWVCSPSSLHYLHVTEALKNNKYVFCEKPLEIDLEKIHAIINNFPNIDKRLMVGFNRRFDPDFEHAKQNISIIGKPTIIKITSRDPAPPPLEYIKISGGIFMDMTIHDLDMARFMANSEVTEVYAIGNVNYMPEMKGIDIDTALITMKFKNGIICNIDNSRVSAYGYDQRLEIHGSEGMIQVGNKKMNQCMVYGNQAIESSVLENFFLDRYQDAYKKEVAVFKDCVINKKKFPSTAFDALKALELAEACGRSIKENKVITVEQNK